MPDLQCVIYETLRLYPAVPFFGRIATKDVTLRPHIAPTSQSGDRADAGGPTPWCGNELEIKAGSGIFIPFSVIHRDPRYWGPTAGEFKPERFKDGIAAACSHPLCVRSWRLL